MTQLILCLEYRKTLFSKEKDKNQTLNSLQRLEKGRYKNVDLRNKVTSMQWFWVKSLFEDDFHD